MYPSDEVPGLIEPVTKSSLSGRAQLIADRIQHVLD